MSRMTQTAFSKELWLLKACADENKMGSYACSRSRRCTPSASRGHRRPLKRGSDLPTSLTCPPTRLGGAKKLNPIRIVKATQTTIDLRFRTETSTSRGSQKTFSGGLEDNNDRLGCLSDGRRKEAASAIGPQFALPYALSAFSFTQRKAFGWSMDIAAEISETNRLARYAIELDRDDARVLAMAGFGLVYVVGDVEEGAIFLARAIQLDPNLVLARTWTKVYLGDMDGAIEQPEVAMRVNPLGPLRHTITTAMAYAHFFAGRNDEASVLATDVVRQQPNFVPGQRIMMACHALAGRIDSARRPARPRCRWILPSKSLCRTLALHSAALRISTNWSKRFVSQACLNEAADDGRPGKGIQAVL